MTVSGNFAGTYFGQVAPTCRTRVSFSWTSQVLVSRGEGLDLVGEDLRLVAGDDVGDT